MKVFLVAALLAVAVADRAPVYRAPETVYRATPVYKAPEPVYKELENEPAPYAFDFSVDDYESGSKFAANENSDVSFPTCGWPFLEPKARAKEPRPRAKEPWRQQRGPSRWVRAPGT